MEQWDEFATSVCETHSTSGVSFELETNALRIQTHETREFRSKTAGSEMCMKVILTAENPFKTLLSNCLSNNLEYFSIDLV